MTVHRVAWLNLVILSLCGFVTSFGAHVVATNLPAYAQQVGVGAFMIGLLIGVYDFAELIVKPWAGAVADTRGMKPVLLCGLFVFILASLTYLWLPVGWLLLVRFLQGMGAAALSTVSIAYVARLYETQRGQALGIYNGLKGMGYVVAPVVGGYLVEHWGFAAIFMVSALVAAVAGLGAATLPPMARVAKTKARTGFALHPVFMVILVCMFLVGLLFGFLPVYLYSIGYSPVGSARLVALATLSYLAVQPLAGHAADRGALSLTLYGGLLLSGLAILAMTFTSGVPLAILVALAGLGVGAVWTNTDALVAAQAAGDRIGAALGVSHSFKELGDMLAPIIAGLLTQLYGVQVAFVSCGALALMAVLWLLASGSRRPRGRIDTV